MITSRILVRLSECQLCGSADLLELGDFNIEDESVRRAFGVEAKSRWCACRECSFTFQNPRLDREYQEQWYEASNYRKAQTAEVISQGYINSAPHQLSRFHPWLLAVGFDLNQIRNCCCLDYGCGIGGALNFLAERNNEIYGVEIDRALAEYGNRHYRIQIVPLTSALPESLHFDFIFSHNALEHVYDPNDFFDFAARRLKSGGVMVLLVPAWRYANTTITLEEFNWAHNCMYDHVSMAGFLNKHGFFLASYLYQNPNAEGDWELCCLAYKSERKNYFSSSLEEVFRELHINIRKRSADRIRLRDKAPAKIASSTV
jgi:SAM-dependent methyltransferase